LASVRGDLDAVLVNDKEFAGVLQKDGESAGPVGEGPRRFKIEVTESRLADGRRSDEESENVRSDATPYIPRRNAILLRRSTSGG
jgi:hypothetical protein